MIESGAYFEAYRHVLKQLQEMDEWDEIPLERFIVRGDSAQIQMPAYIRQLIIDRGESLNEEVNKMNLDQSQFEALNHAL